MPSSHHVDSIVIGAGVMGLAVARVLALSGREVVILEAATDFGTGISSRSSEVIHAGLYYPTDSLKARLCVRGNALLYDYCRRHQVAHRRPGKLLVATRSAEEPRLEAIARQAEANGVTDLSWLERRELKRLEPALDTTRALLSPSSGIVDSHGLMRSLLGVVEDRSGVLARRAPVIGGRLDTPGQLEVAVGGDVPMTLGCRELINCAGLQAQAVANTLRGGRVVPIPPRYLAKGHYFSLNGRAPFHHLIYPVPQTAGLGIHLTLDLGGQARFGPDVEWVDHEDYQVDPRRQGAFEVAIRRYWPDLPADRLQPAYAGLRPKLHPPEGGTADFMIQGPRAHGVAGWINLFGIESPGLTASLALAETVLAELDDPA